MELTKNETEILLNLIENEIESDVDVIKDTDDEKEKECWKEEILILKDILLKFKPIELVIQT